MLNFPSADLYDRCSQTIQNNAYDMDELAMSGLTAEPATTVNAPRIRECFMSLECRFLWDKKLDEQDHHVLMCFEIVNVVIDESYLDEKQKGRYGESGLLYNIHYPVNPESFGGNACDYLGTITKLKKSVNY